MNEDFLDLAVEIAASDLMFADDEDADDEGGISVDDAAAEMAELVRQAVDFMNSQIIPKWEDADRFFDGETDIKIIPDRSSAVKTVVRDIIRGIKPSVMRVFTQYPEIVAYTPADNLDFMAATVAQAQTAYVNNMFWTSGGYMSLSNCVHNTLLKKVGVMKAHYLENNSDEYVTMTSVTPEQLEMIEQMPEAHVVSVEEMAGDASGLMQVEVAIRKTSGNISLEDVPLNEFFVDEAATSPEDAQVIGQRRTVTVGYARKLGLEYDGEWLELDSYDPELNEDATGAAARRGYHRQGREAKSIDESKHRFLLTEAYSYFDLDGTGIPQLYRFWLGGTSYTYIDHERVEENPYGVICCDPVPGSFFGYSLYDVLSEEQNTQTSLLRAAVDNAHLANNRRIAFHETLVNVHDVMNRALGSPIRFRQAGNIQEIGTESTLGSMLPMLQYMEQGAQNKSGMTNAAMGLDADALQSTDKEAVRNTIQLAQGQVELICRNIAETGLKAVFTKLLKLSLRHKPREQVIYTNGIALPVDQALFSPEMTMKVAVGMGTGNTESRIAALNMLMPQQQQFMQTYGLANPVCGLQHVMNAMTDLATLMGIPNMGRYINQVSPDVIQQLEQIAQEKAAAAQPPDPAHGMLMLEQARAQGALQDRQMQIEWEREKAQQAVAHDTAKLLTDDDFRRDKLAQDEEIARMRWLGEQVARADLSQENERDRAVEMQKEIMNLLTTIQNRGNPQGAQNV